MVTYSRIVPLYIKECFFSLSGEDSLILQMQMARMTRILKAVLYNLLFKTQIMFIMRRKQTSSCQGLSVKPRCDTHRFLGVIGS